MARTLPLVSLAGIVAVSAYFSLYLFQMGCFADDPGVGWHLKTGELIWNSRAIPRVDPFLATERRAWIADQWLSDLLLFVLYEAGGWALLYVTLAAVWIVTFFGVLFPAIRVQVGSAVGSLIVTLAAFKAAQVHFILRPVVFSICCFVCAFVVARDLSRRDSIPAHTLLLRGASLIALFVVWSNLHPAFVLGLFVVLIVPLVRFLHGVGRSQDLASVSVVAVLCVVATCLNPYGLGLHESIVSLGRSAYFLNLNSEWLPPSLGSFEGATLVGMVTVPLIAGIASPSFRKKVGWFDIIATGLLAFEAFGSVRFIPFAVVAGAFPLAAALTTLAGLQKVSVLRLSARCVQAVERHEARGARVEVVALLCAVAGILWSGFMPLPQALGPQGDRYPRELLEAIRTDAPEGIVLASPDWGGFITANLYPAFKAVIDDRNTLIGEDLYRQYFLSLDSPQVLSALVGRFGVTHIILPRGSTLGRELASERRWPILLDDGKSLVVRVVRQ